MNRNIHHIDNIDVDVFYQLSQGDEKAFREVAQFYFRRMLPFTILLVKSKLEAEDVLQEVLLKLWLNRASLASIQNPIAWMNTVLAHIASNHMRSRLRYDLKIKELIQQTPDTEQMCGEVDAFSTQRAIDEAVCQLPVRRKQIFLLSRREGLTRKEIASRLNISENTVRNQLVEAISFIREYLKREGTVITILTILFQKYLTYFFF